MHSPSLFRHSCIHRSQFWKHRRQVSSGMFSICSLSCGTEAVYLLDSHHVVHAVFSQLAQARGRHMDCARLRLHGKGGYHGWPRFAAGIFTAVQDEVLSWWCYDFGRPSLITVKTMGKHVVVHKWAVAVFGRPKWLLQHGRVCIRKWASVPDQHSGVSRA